MQFWWLDRVAPGVVSGLVFAAPVWVSHVLLRRHITRVTKGQNDHIDKLTAAQTATITGHRDHEGDA